MYWAYIYKLINPENDLSYIGSTMTTPKKRHIGHIGNPGGKMKQFSREKIQSFKLHILEYGFFDNISDFEDIEDIYIIKFDTITNGYNSRLNKPYKWIGVYPKNIT